MVEISCGSSQFSECPVHGPVHACQTVTCVTSDRQPSPTFLSLNLNFVASGHLKSCMLHALAIMATINNDGPQLHSSAIRTTTKSLHHNIITTPPKEMSTTETTEPAGEYSDCTTSYYPHYIARLLIK